MLLGRVGRPGLLGTIARTEVVAGTASMTANAVNRRAQQRAEEQQEAQLYEQQASVPAQPAPPAPPAPPTAVAGTFDDMVGQLTRLADLHQSGALTDEEFVSAKRELLAR